MTRKPTTKPPEERRLRKQLREVLQVYAADTSKFNTDATVRELLSLIDDEVRRTRMSYSPAVNPGPRDDVMPMSCRLRKEDHGGILFEDELSPMTDEEYKERTEIKKAIMHAALEGKLLTSGGK